VSELRGARTFGIARPLDHDGGPIGLCSLPEITNLRIERSLEGRPRGAAFDIGGERFSLVTMSVGFRIRSTVVIIKSPAVKSAVPPPTSHDRRATKFPKLRSSLWRAGSGVLPLGYTRVALFVANEGHTAPSTGDALLDQALGSR